MSYYFKQEVLARLTTLEQQNSTIITMLKGLKMALSKDYLDLAKKIDDATTAVGNKIAALTGQIKNSMTDQEVADTKAALQAEVDKLTAMGADPVNPIPTP